MISYIIPTRDRALRLKQTLLALEALGPHPCPAEVIVADNASEERAILPTRLESGLAVREVRLSTNEGAAARNHAGLASDPSSRWLVMLDDDSHPVHLDFVASLRGMASDVAAVSADIFLPGASGADAGLNLSLASSAMPREAGGLPEVFIGCGVAIRRDVFLELGGYDPAFQYYAEEYDLAARMLLAGQRVRFEPSFVVHHHKDARHRDMNLILSRLVRNNSWVARRYAPDEARAGELRETRRRYRRIAAKEHALAGFGRGLLEARRTLRAQPRTAMPRRIYDRFTGLSAAAESLQRAHRCEPFRSARIVDEGKNAWVVARALDMLGVTIVDDGRDPDVLVIGTMSPGPMLDAVHRRLSQRHNRGPRVVAPWTMAAREPALVSAA